MTRDIKEVIDLIQKANNHPQFSVYSALAVDRFLKQLYGDDGLVTFAQHGLSPNSNCKISGLVISPYQKKAQHILKETEKLYGNDYQKFCTHVFKESKGHEIDTLNLIYANLVISKPAIWAYFINKYLMIHGGWQLNLSGSKVEFGAIEGGVLSGTKSKYEEIKVSILMPAFNNADTIRHSSLSVLKQTHQNIELIIIDDASTDRTAEVCQKLVELDSRVKYIRNKANVGAYVSRNRGLKIATGDYITILDGDDWSFPQRIAYQLERILAEKTAVAHMGYYLRITSDGFITAFRSMGLFSHDGALHKCLATLMIKTSFMRESLGYWDIVRYGADAELYKRLVKFGVDKVIEDKIPLLLAQDRHTSLTNTSGSKLNGASRQIYINNFSRWHESTELTQLRLDFLPEKRPFEIHPDMVVNPDSLIKVITEDVDTSPKINVGIFGTCLIHRPFLKNNIGTIVNNTKDNVKMYYPKVGFLHTLPEICQAIQVIDGSLAIPDELSAFVFRKENTSTTPQNEFDQEIESKILQKSKLYVNRNYISNLDILVIEISSLAVNLHVKSGLFLHTNPNFIQSVPYKDIYPSYYEKFHPDMDVKKISLDEEQLTKWMKYLKYLVKNIPIVVTGHLNSSKYPNMIRQRINNILDNISGKCNVFFFDTTPFVDKYGYKLVNGVEDKHHLSDLGENEYSHALQQVIEKVIKENECNKSKPVTDEFTFTSIGENCLSQGILKRYNLNSIISPFSWGRSNVDYLIQLVQEDFQDLLNPAHLIEKNISGKNIIINNKYQCDAHAFSSDVSRGFEFTHHNVKDREDVRKSYFRKIERFKSLMNNGSGILLYHHRNAKQKNTSHVENQLLKLLSMVPSKNLFIVNFHQLIVTDIVDRGITINRNGNLFNVVLSTFKLWGGNNEDEFWGIVDDDLLKQMVSEIIKIIYLSI